MRWGHACLVREGLIFLLALPLTFAPRVLLPPRCNLLILLPPPLPLFPPAHSTCAPLGLPPPHTDFFDQNPLSQLGIVVARDGVAEALTELSGSPEAQIKKLEEGKIGGCPLCHR